jgi:hypothetical protein
MHAHKHACQEQWNLEEIQIKKIKNKIVRET